MPFLRPFICFAALGALVIGFVGLGLWLWWRDDSQAPLDSARNSNSLETEDATLPVESALGESLERMDRQIGSLPLSREMGVVVSELVEESVEPGHSHVVGIWRGRLSPPIEDWEALSRQGSEGKGTQWLSLPNGDTYLLRNLRHGAMGEGKGTLIASIEGRAFADVAFAYVNEAASGVVRLPSEGRAWEIRNGGEGTQIFELVDLEGLGKCGGCEVAYKR